MRKILILNESENIKLIDEENNMTYTPKEMVGYTMASLFGKQIEHREEKSRCKKKELETQMYLQSEILNSLVNALNVLER